MTEDGWPAAVARPAKKQPAKQETAAFFLGRFLDRPTGTQMAVRRGIRPGSGRAERTVPRGCRPAETTRPTPVRCCSLPEIMPMKWRSKRNARRKQSPDWCSLQSETLYRNRPGQRTPGNPRARQGRVVRRSFPARLVPAAERPARRLVPWYSPDGRNWTKADKSCETRAITTTWLGSS